MTNVAPFPSTGNLPHAVHDALMRFVEELVQAFPLATAEAIQVDRPSPGGPDRFPRTSTELLVLDALDLMWPMRESPLQVAAMIHQPHLTVRSVLQALAMLGTIAHPNKGYYARYAVPEDGRPSAGSAARQPDSLPSARYASQIAALCGPSSTNRKE